MVSKSMPFLSAYCTTWSLLILPKPKYLLWGWAKYQPLTEAAGSMAMDSVKMIPADSGAPSRLNSVDFSVWSGHAG